MNHLGKYALETSIELISHNLSVLPISSRKNLEILIFGFANFWSYIMLTVLSVSMLVGLCVLVKVLGLPLPFVCESNLCLAVLVTEILLICKTAGWQLCG